MARNRERLPAGGLRTATILVFIYLFSVGVHYSLLYSVTAAPYVGSDELQYSITGENLRSGNGYMFRGAFYATAPPVFPLFVALGHSLSENHRQGVFILSVFTVCSLLFPVFLICRHLDFSGSTPYLTALAASFLPQTFYAGMYMSEVVQLPLFFLAFWGTLLWFRNPRILPSLLLGILFGVMMLNRVGTVTFLISVCAVAAILSIRQNRDGIAKQRYGLPLAIIVVTCAAFQVWWWIYKVQHGATAMGMYGSAPERWKKLTLELFISYMGDSLLAPGLITVAPFIAGCYWIWKRNAPAGLLLAMTSCLLVIATTLVDGSETGFIRERYHVYAFPLMMIAAVQGQRLCDSVTPRWIGRFLIFALPLAALFSMSMWDFAVPPLFENSWAHIVGGSWDGAFDRKLLLSRSIILIGVAGIILCWTWSRRTFVLPLYLLLFNLFGLAKVAHGLSLVTTDRAEQASVIASLFPSPLKNMQRVLVAGSPPWFESRVIPTNPRFSSANQQSLIDYTVWWVEMLKLLDVRTCSTPTCVLEPDAKDAFLLSSIEFPNLKLTGRRRNYFLYDLRGSKPVLPIRRPLEISANRFQTTELSERLLKGEIAGTGTHKRGLLVSGPNLVLPAGSYQLNLDADVPRNERLYVDVLSSGVSSTVMLAPLGKAPSLKFSVPKQGPVEFRLSGTDRADFVLRGSTIQPLSAPWLLSQTRYSWEIPASRFGSLIGKRLGEGQIAGSDDGTSGYLIFGPYMKFPPGTYEVTYHLSGPSGISFITDVMTDKILTTQTGNFDIRKPFKVRFTHNGAGDVQFRLVTANSAAWNFRGVTLKSLD